jgi:Helix-turn-helix domain
MPRLFRTRFAAEVVGVSPATLEKLRSVGGGPPYKRVGACILYPEAELLAWIEALLLHRSTADGGPARAAGPGRPRRAPRSEVAT